MFSFDSELLLDGFDGSCLQVSAVGWDYRLLAVKRDPDVGTFPLPRVEGGSSVFQPPQELGGFHCLLK